MKKMMFMALVILSFSTLINAQFAGGDGTKDNPYQISNAVELDSMRYHSYSYFELTNDIDLGVAPYDSAGSVDNKGWLPIGDVNSLKRYMIDGKGHTIKNMYINRVGENSVGLFSNVYCTEIKNITLENCNVSGKYQVGAFCGTLYSYPSIIENCKVSGVVKGEKKVGGLVGYGYNNTRYKKSISNAVVTMNNPGNAGTEFGGLVGEMYSNGKIDSCSARGNVEGNYTVGGVIGKAESYITITNSYATGIVKGVSDLGGFIGYIEQNVTVEKCYATGDVVGQVGSIGGFVGFSNGKTLVKNCYSNGSVKGMVEVGGFVGTLVTDSVVNCYSTGYVNYSKSGGGFFAYNINKISLKDCFYDKETSTKSDNTGNTFPKTTVEMKAQSTFTNWDFNSIWTIDEGQSYPTLQQFTDVPTSTIQEPVEKNSSDILVYPNPVEDVLHIKTKISGDISLINRSGRVIAQIHGCDVAFDTSVVGKMKKGTYWAVLKVKGETVSVSKVYKK